MNRVPTDEVLSLVWLESDPYLEKCTSILIDENANILCTDNILPIKVRHILAGGKLAFDLLLPLVMASIFMKFFKEITLQTAPLNICKWHLYTLAISGSYTNITGPCEIFNSVYKIKLEKHQKAVIRGEKMKGMADHVWREKCSHQPLFNQVKMLGRQHWIIGCLKESAHILGDKGLFG